MEKTTIIVPKAGSERDFLIAKIKKLYHKKEYLKWEDSGGIWRNVCKFCGQEKFKSKEICSGRILRWSTWIPSSLKLLDEIISDSNISFVNLKIAKGYPNSVYEIETYMDDNKHVEIKGKSMSDVISHLWIKLKAG